MEDPRNWGPVHPECAPKPDPILAQKPADWFVGKFVKLAFSVPDELVAQGGPEKEHMWVKVDRVAAADEFPDGEELVGDVNNDPQFAVQWANGTTIAFKREEVEQAILEDGSFYQHEHEQAD